MSANMSPCAWGWPPPWPTCWLHESTSQTPSLHSPWSFCVTQLAIPLTIVPTPAPLGSPYAVAPMDLLESRLVMGPVLPPRVVLPSKRWMLLVLTPVGKSTISSGKKVVLAMPTVIVSSPVQYPTPPTVVPGGFGTSLRLGVQWPDSPVAPMTSHLSLQYAYLTPRPLSTFARNVPLQMPVVRCVQVARHEPWGACADGKALGWELDVRL